MTCTAVFINNKHKITTGLFTENTIVVAEGEMLVEGIFQVCTTFAFKFCINRWLEFSPSILLGVSNPLVCREDLLSLRQM